jgi:ankyrin repeat protein
MSNYEMHVAVKNGDLNKVKELVEKGAFIMEFDENKDTPMHIACKYKKWDIIKFLLDNGGALSMLIHNNDKELPEDCITKFY